MNLLKGTLDLMLLYDKDITDIRFFGIKGECYFSIFDFEKMFNIEYDDGFGGTNIPETLVIVFKDNAWLERHEYDGSEWWEYKETPIKPKDRYIPLKPITDWDMIDYSFSDALESGCIKKSEER